MSYEPRGEEGMKWLAWTKRIKVQRKRIWWTTLRSQKCMTGSARDSGNSRSTIYVLEKLLNSW